MHVLGMFICYVEQECNFDLKVRGQKLAVKFYVDNVVDDSEAQLAGIIKGL